MSFITPPILITPAQQFHLNLLQMVNGFFNQAINQLNSFYRQIWNNSDQVNFSPDKAWAALGKDAVKLRAAFLAFVQFINSAAPGALPLVEPAGWILTQNQDGSISAVKSSQGA